MRKYLVQSVSLSLLKMILLSNNFVFKGHISWVMTNFLLVISNHNYVQWWFLMTFSPTEWNNTFQNWDFGTFGSSKSHFFPPVNRVANLWTHILLYFHIGLYKSFYKKKLIKCQKISFISIFFICLSLLQLEKLFFNGFGNVNIRMEITFSFNPLDICIKHLDIWVNFFFLIRFDPAVWCSKDTNCQAHQVCVLITFCTSVTDMMLANFYVGRSQFLGLFWNLELFCIKKEVRNKTYWTRK